MPQSQLLITNGVVALPAGPLRASVLCAGHRIVAIGRDVSAPGAQVFDARGLQIGPGFIDVHVHGGGGHTFFAKDPAGVDAYAAWAPRNGVTSFLVSTVGHDARDTVAVLSNLVPAIHAGADAEPLGFHLEGPFINPVRKGAFPARYLRAPSRAEFLRFNEAASGLIRQVTLAPELRGASNLISAVSAAGAIPAMGHTDATAAEARAGFELGVRHVTHLFNAMRPLHQREGGPIAAALLETSLTCELIFDGAHVTADVLRLAYSVLGAHRTVVVTDNLELAGAAKEHSRFGGGKVSVAGDAAVRDDGTIVGSVATYDQHFRNAVRFLNVDLGTAFRLCSANPARLAQVANRKGAIKVGMDADLVLLDDALEIAATVCRGNLAFERSPGRLLQPR